MKCSDCSLEVKPVIAMDIDGTMADYHGHFICFAEKYLGLKPGLHDFFAYSGEGSFKEWGCEAWKISEETWHDIKLAYRQGAQKRSAPAYKTIVLPRLIQEAGGEVWLTTTRPYLRLDGIDPDTRAWLDRNQVPYDGLIYGEDKYQMLADRIEPERVVAVLDDLPEMYDRAADLFGAGVPVLWHTNYNSAIERPNWVASVDGARYAIDIRMEGW